MRKATPEQIQLLNESVHHLHLATDRINQSGYASGVTITLRDAIDRINAIVGRLIEGQS